MKDKMVWVAQTHDLMRVERIFKSKNAAYASGDPYIVSMKRSEAVRSIRNQIFYRSKGFCELCGDIVTLYSGHMHEQKWRGRGGEISLENSVFICAKTHKLEHKDRSPQFTRRKS